jgi:parallel beta-helix repeat protein
LAVIFNEATGGGVGIVVENSLPGTVHLEANRVHDNTIGGIQLVGSDGVLIDDRNKANDDGTFGIEVDANSDDNVIEGNRAFGNTFDLANLGGTGNCFKHNRYETSEGDVSCPS